MGEEINSALLDFNPITVDDIQNRNWPDGRLVNGVVDVEVVFDTIRINSPISGTTM